MATHTVPQCPGCGTHAPAPASTEGDLWTVSMIEGAGPLTLCPECSGSERRAVAEAEARGRALLEQTMRKAGAKPFDAVMFVRGRQRYSAIAPGRTCSGSRRTP